MMIAVVTIIVLSFIIIVLQDYGEKRFERKER